MTLVLRQVVAYPPLEDNDEHRVREIFSTIDDTSCPLIEYVLDDASSCDEDIDQMEAISNCWTT